MTRQEFIDNVNWMDDLMRVCYDAELSDYEDNYKDSRAFDDWARFELEYLADSYGWRDAVGIAYDWPYGYDWYAVADGEPYGIGDYEFEELKNTVLDDLDNMEWFEPEEEIEDNDVFDFPAPEPLAEEPEIEEEDDRPDLNDEAFDICGMVDDSAAVVKQMKEEREAKNREMEDAFSALLEVRRERWETLYGSDGNADCAPFVATTSTTLPFSEEESTAAYYLPFPEEESTATYNTRSDPVFFF